MKVLARGENLMPEMNQDASYPDQQQQPQQQQQQQPQMQPQMQQFNDNSMMMQRPNSIDVKSAAYYQQLQLQQQQQQQQYNRGAPGGGAHNNGGIGYNQTQQENIYMPRVLRNHDEEHPSPKISSSSNNGGQLPHPYPPHAHFEATQPSYYDQNQQLSPNSRALGSPSRPSQPPPAPPPTGMSPAGTPTRGSRAGSNQRESLPPPPPPPMGGESEMQNGHGINIFGERHAPLAHQEDLVLPPPPPNPDSNNLLGVRFPAEHLPPSPPPPPPATSMAPPPAAPPPPPPPPPSDQMNGLRITNGDLAKNLKVILNTFEGKNQIFFGGQLKHYFSCFYRTRSLPHQSRREAHLPKWYCLHKDWRNLRQHHIKKRMVSDQISSRQFVMVSCYFLKSFHRKLN
jgi:hypothetical protein